VLIQEISIDWQQGHLICSPISSEFFLPSVQEFQWLEGTMTLSSCRSRAGLLLGLLTHDESPIKNGPHLLEIEGSPIAR
jgi:hypothetical protein